MAQSISRYCVVMDNFSIIGKIENDGFVDEDNLNFTLGWRPFFFFFFRFLTYFWHARSSSLYLIFFLFYIFVCIAHIHMDVVPPGPSDKRSQTWKSSRIYSQVLVTIARWNMYSYMKYQDIRIYLYHILEKLK